MRFSAAPGTKFQSIQRYDKIRSYSRLEFIIEVKMKFGPLDPCRPPNPGSLHPAFAGPRPLHWPWTAEAKVTKQLDSNQAVTSNIQPKIGLCNSNPPFKIQMWIL